MRYDEDRSQDLVTLNMLRTQREMEDEGSTNACLADFIAPTGDYVGAFT